MKFGIKTNVIDVGLREMSSFSVLRGVGLFKKGKVLAKKGGLLFCKCKIVD